MLDTEKICSERGESTFRVIFLAAIFGLACYVIFTLRSCIYNYKESKVRYNRKAEYEKYKKMLPKPERRRPTEVIKVR